MTFFRSYAELLEETRFLSPSEEAIAFPVKPETGFL